MNNYAPQMSVKAPSPWHVLATQVSAAQTPSLRFVTLSFFVHMVEPVTSAVSKWQLTGYNCALAMTANKR